MPRLFTVINLTFMPDRFLSNSTTQQISVATGMKFNENEIKKILNNIGSIPITLLSIESRVEKGLSLDDFISMTVSGTRNKLKGFKHQLILIACFLYRSQS